MFDLASMTTKIGLTSMMRMWLGRCLLVKLATLLSILGVVLTRGMPALRTSHMPWISPTTPSRKLRLRNGGGVDQTRPPKPSAQVYAVDDAFLSMRRKGYESSGEHRLRLTPGSTTLRALSSRDSQFACLNRTSSPNSPSLRCGVFAFLHP